MKKGTSVLPLMILILVILAFWPLEVKAGNTPTYLPVGPQTNVPVATVTGGGWTECYRDTYANFSLNLNFLLSQCSESLLMLACRETGSSILTLLAQGNRSDVTFDTGVNTNVLNVANGVGWYFNNTGNGVLGDSWGFVRAGDTVDKNNCDVDMSGANAERLCWYLTPGATDGWRCGVTTSLPDDVDFERIVYMASPPQIPTLNQWGKIITMAVIGLVAVIGIFAMRRRTAVVSN